MKLITKKLSIVCVIVFIVGCTLTTQVNEDQEENNKAVLSDQVALATQQYQDLVERAKIEGSIPRTIENEEIRWINKKFDWTEGFFPGSLWYLYELTGEKLWKSDADFFQSMIYDDRFFSNHDLGFVFNCSYGNGLRLAQNRDYEVVMIDAANTLLARFDPEVGCIKSWNVDSGWQSQRGWQYPVIIDNMMNLELLFKVSALTGDDKYKNAAITHANTTMKNHFRDDMSSFHVVDYDSITGEVRSRQTAQGFAHESAWARGQAWGLYGYTMCYRYTKDQAYLNQARKIAAYILSQSATVRGIPYWDYHAPGLAKQPVDASAAAITTSALIELSQYGKPAYLDHAQKLFDELSSPRYFARQGQNKNFLLMHSVGSIPHNNEIDKPLNYADYYYLESLVRLTKK